MPPLHHQVVTLELDVSPGDVADARSAAGGRAGRPRVVVPGDARGARHHRGLGAPVPAPVRAEAGRQQHVPVDLRASKAAGREVRVIEDAERFQSDPDATILEANDAVILLRSDSLDAIRQGSDALVTKLDFWKPTSIRRGFAGGGFDGGTSLPKRMAMAAGRRRRLADPRLGRAVPRLHVDAEGVAGPGPDRQHRDARLRRPAGRRVLQAGHHDAPVAHHPGSRGLVPDLRPRPAGLQHLQARAEGGAGRADGAAGQGGRRHRRDQHQRLREAPVDRAQRVAADGVAAGRGRRSARTARATRRARRCRSGPTSTRSTTRSPGAAGPRPTRWSDEPAAGLHFVVFHPTSDDFRRVRRAMDGQMPDGTRIPLRPKDRGQGINSVLTTTHRQNFLVPPRRARVVPALRALSCNNGVRPRCFISVAMQQRGLTPLLRQASGRRTVTSACMPRAASSRKKTSVGSFASGPPTPGPRWSPRAIICAAIDGGTPVE